MKRFEKTIPKEHKHPSSLRSAWVLVIVCLCSLVGITSVLSSSQTSNLLTPIQGWSETASLPTALAGKNAVVYDVENDGQDDFVFFIGGRNAVGAPVQSVYMAPINASGQLDSWQSVSLLPQPLFLHSADIANGYIYVMGGWKGSEPTQNTVYRSQISSDGTLSGWTAVSEYAEDLETEPAKASQHGSAIVTVEDAGVERTFLYGIGGWEGTFTLNKVYAAEIGSNGNILSWQSVAPLPVPMRRVAVAAYENRIFVTGGIDGTGIAGQDSNGNPLKTVYVGTVASDGTVSQWVATTELPRPLFYHRAVVHDGNLVVMGGKEVNNGADLTDVYSAQILPNGTLGSWTQLPNIPEGLFRFAAVTVRRWNSDYIMVLGGGQGPNASPVVQNKVYYSDIPPTPTPTSSPTPTATPTPPVAIDLEVSNEPGGWVAPGDEITYTIRYTNEGPGTALNTQIDGKIPANTEFVNGSGIPAQTNLSGISEGSDISWSVGSLPPNSTGTIQYTVRRLEPMLPQNAAIDVVLTGPATGTSAQEITYTLNITNNVGGLGSTLVDIQLPPEATYIRSSNGGTLGAGNKLFWSASGLPAGTWSLDFVLTAQDSLVIHDYEVQAQLMDTADVVCCGVGRYVVVTMIDGRPITGPGDGTSIVNDDVEISWTYNGQEGTYEAAQVRNPRPVTDFLFLPLTNGGSRGPGR